jgi:hypothetical protein
MVFGHGANLVQFDQHGIGRLLTDSAPDEGQIGHENIVADDLKMPRGGSIAFPRCGRYSSAA